MASKHPSQGGEVANGGGVPSPGAFVTPQAGSGVERMDIQKFFDPSTYRGKSIGLPPLGPSQPMTDLTPENLRRFFDPATYHGKMVCLPPMCTTFIPWAEAASRISSCAPGVQSTHGEV